MTSIVVQVAGAGIEPAASRFRAGRHYQQQLSRSVFSGMTRSLSRRFGKFRGAGVEPALAASKAAGLPLADPRVCVMRSVLRESNPPGRVGGPAPVPLGQGHVASCGGRNRTCDQTVNSRPPVPAQAPPQFRGQRSEFRSQRSEFRSQRSEFRSQKSEVRRAA